MQGFTRKYVHGHLLEPGLVALYGRQVLEARLAVGARGRGADGGAQGMRYLLACGVPLGHIHSGNVLIDSGVARITDWENTLLGLQPQAPRRTSVRPRALSLPVLLSP
jgi:hypothetical protein